MTSATGGAQNPARSVLKPLLPGYDGVVAPVVVGQGSFGHGPWSAKPTARYGMMKPQFVNTKFVSTRKSEAVVWRSAWNSSIE